MFIVDSHCDSIQRVDEGVLPLVNPYNFSKKHKQLQFVAFLRRGRVLSLKKAISGRSDILKNSMPVF